MLRHLLLAALLALGTLALAPDAAAKPDTPAACTDAVNDPGCPGGVCVWPTPTSAGACAKHLPAHACTLGHAPCGDFDWVCVYGSIVSTECVTIVCACDPFTSVSLPAAPECTGCTPWVCVAGVTSAACWGADGPHDVCMGFSLQVPFCTDVPCKDCVTIDCSRARPLCDPTHPCAWGWVECAPCACVPQDLALRDGLAILP